MFCKTCEPGGGAVNKGSRLFRDDKKCEVCRRTNSEAHMEFSIM